MKLSVDLLLGWNARGCLCVTLCVLQVFVHNLSATAPVEFVPVLSSPLIHVAGLTVPPRASRA